MSHSESEVHESEPSSDQAEELWLRREAADAFDALQADPAGAIPAADLRSEFADRWAARR